MHAARSTHSPIGRMSPVSSAPGMNSSGGVNPSSGLFHRSSASMPQTLPVPKSNCGWKSSESSPPAMAPRNLLSMIKRLKALVFMAESKNVIVPGH